MRRAVTFSILNKRKITLGKNKFPNVLYLHMSEWNIQNETLWIFLYHLELLLSKFFVILS